MVGVRYFGSVSKRLHVCQDKKEKESHVSTERGKKAAGFDLGFSRKEFGSMTRLRLTITQ